jgi:RHS repeat-associated protein
VAPTASGQADRAVLPQVIEQRDGAGDVTDQFVWGPAYVDELLLHERDADGDGDLDQRLYGVHDRQYSVLTLTDEDGDAVEEYAYSPYGADPLDPRQGVAQRTDSAAALPITPGLGAGQFLYSGCRFDAAIGLNHHRARSLSHNLGRWAQQEPAGVTGSFGGLPGKRHGGPPQRQYADGPNVYAYVQNNPVTRTDPTGLALLPPLPIAFWDWSYEGSEVEPFCTVEHLPIDLYQEPGTVTKLTYTAGKRWHCGHRRGCSFAAA